MHELATLEAMVKATNNANAYAERLALAMRDAFAKFVGQQVLKVDGKLMKKCEVPMPDHAPAGNTYFLSSDYSLVWVVKTCENIEGADSCVYFDTSVYVGDIDNRVLTELCTPFTGRSDYTVEEVLRKRAALEKAYQVHQAAKSDLCVATG